MNFCDNCYFVSEATRCPFCGSKKLRQARDDDFCFLTEKSSAYGDMLLEVFKEHGIPCSAMPCGSGIETQFAMPLKNYRLFVPFSFLNEAKSIVLEIEKAETENLRDNLLKNENSLYASEKVEKKIRKKIRLSGESNFIKYCVGIIQAANKIVSEGRITGCLQGGYYLFCYSDDMILSDN